MCVTSMVGDHYREKWKDRVFSAFPDTQPTPNYIPPWPFPNKNPDPEFISPPPTPGFINPSTQSPVLDRGGFATQTDLEALKKEVMEMKDLLKRALKYDEDNNEPHCEMDEKVNLLKKVAAMVGVSLEDIFPPKESVLTVKSEK